jgi:short-subunit dehydrogenase
MSRKKKTALITGASSGIGYELARLFAISGFHVVIVARDKEKLDETAGKLRKLGADKVTVIPEDLAVAGGAAAVYGETSKKGIDIDVLVNDAGVGEHGFFHETSLEKELKIIQLNVASLVEMTKLYLKDMLSRGEGKILQVASIASYQPIPKLAVYAASKAFVLSFTDALINELKDTGVTMTALIPDATDTEFFKRAHAENTVAAKSKLEDPAIVAKVGFEALMKGEHHALAPGVGKQILMSSLMSNDTLAAMTRKQMEEKHN